MTDRGGARWCSSSWALVTAGGVLAALPLGLEWLIVGRGLQGFGLGLTPVAIATARDALTGERSRSTVAALSVTVAAGVGLGYPTAGLIAEIGGVHAAFWTGAAISFLALLAAAAVLPPSPDAPPGGSTCVGAVLLGAGLAGLLLCLGEAEVWGWTLAAAVGRGGRLGRRPAGLAVLGVAVAVAAGRPAAGPRAGRRVRARRGAAGRAVELPAARLDPDPRPGARGRGRRVRHVDRGRRA